MDVWGLALVSGHGHEGYFLLVVDGYTRYTTVFPLRSKVEVPDVLIPWIRAIRFQLRERFCHDLPVLRLHSDRGGEFSSDLLRDFCRGEGILQSFTSPASPQQNGIAERCIGLVMELNLWPCVSFPETSPTLRWTGEVGDACVFRVWGSCAFVRDTSADKLFDRAILCVFLGFPADAPGWQFYHPTSHHVLPSQDIMFDESVPFYCLFPYRSAPLPPPPLFLAPGPPPVDPLPPQGPTPSGSYAVYQLNLWPCVSFPETSPTLRWTGEVGDACVFRVWGSCAFVRDTSADKLFDRAILCVFLGFPADAPGWQFYHPTSHHVLPSQDITFDESVPFYCLFPYRSAPLPPPPLFLAPDGDSGAARGDVSGGPEPGGDESEGASLRVRSLRVLRLGVLCLLEVLWVPCRGGSISPPQLHEWFARRTRLQSGAAGAGGAARVGAGGIAAGAAGGTGAAGPGGARIGGTRAAGAGGAVGVGAGGTGAGAAGVTGAAGPGDARTGGTGAASAGGAVGVGAGDTGARAAGAGAARADGAAGVGAGDTGSRGAGPGGAGAVGAGSRDTGRPRPYFPASSLPAPSPYIEKAGGLTERREPMSHPALPVRAFHTGHCVPRQRLPPVPSMHHMALRPSSVPQRVPLPSPLVSSLADGPDPESDLVRATSPYIPLLLATFVIDPLFEFAALSALVAELVDFAASCRLDNAASLVVESESDCPPSVGGECALGTDVLEDRQEEFECFVAAVPHLVSMQIAPEGDPDAPDIPTPRSFAEAITGPNSSRWQTAMDAEMAS
ncbi:unnamed protein product [Closterium sp. NIES-54]